MIVLLVTWVVIQDKRSTVNMSAVAYVLEQAARRREVEDAAARAIEEAGLPMREASLSRLDRSFVPLELAVGATVRISLLVLSDVRRLLKSQLVGAPLPLYSTELFKVKGARREHDRLLYRLKCTSCGDGAPRPALVNGMLAQLPRSMVNVERRFLLLVPAGTTASMGRLHPDWTPVLRA